MAMKKNTDHAELDDPGIVCRNCRFTSSLQGHWLEQQGHLVFVCEPDPQPRRGPDLSGCGECGARFSYITTDWGSKKLDGNVLAAVRDTAQKAREKEWAEWEASDEREA